MNRISFAAMQSTTFFSGDIESTIESDPFLLQVSVSKYAVSPVISPVESPVISPVTFSLEPADYIHTVVSILRIA